MSEIVVGRVELGARAATAKDDLGAVERSVVALEAEHKTLYDLLRRVLISAGGVAEPGVSINFLRHVPDEVAALRAERDQLKAERDRMRAALLDAGAALGQGGCTAIKCDGCDAEADEARHAIYEGLGVAGYSKLMVLLAEEGGARTEGKQA